MSGEEVLGAVVAALVGGSGITGLEVGYLDRKSVV